MKVACGPRTVALDGGVVRFGTDPTCQLQLEGSGIQPVHGELDGDSLNPLHPCWVNGQPAAAGRLSSGDSIRVGSPEGPELLLLGEEEPTSQVHPIEESAVTEMATLPLEPTEVAIAPYRANSVETELAPVVTEGTNSLIKALAAVDHAPEEVANALTKAKQEIDQARSAAGGARSGKTMMIVAHALAGVSETGQQKTRRSRRWLAGVIVLALLVVAGLSAVIYEQNRRINALIAEKQQIDAQIQAVLLAMDETEDEAQLAELETRWEQLVGFAAEKVSEVKRASAARAEELSRPTDALDKDIRRILHSFHADTYAIPPVFRRALQEQVQELSKAPNLPAVFERKRALWPDIQAALKRKELPAELGYIAFTESNFDPDAVNPKSGASGMWQLMDPIARQCGISTAPGNDERFNPRRSSDAAACYLSNLLVEFGEESFMLALASYNRGENGVRRALHQLAEQPGGFRKRDFWHLYRTKYLPQETREYVPKVLAAAIVLDGP